MMSITGSQHEVKHIDDAVQAWEVLRGKWTIQILREILHGPIRLSQLKRRIPAASKKALIASLRSLERHQFIHRRDLSGTVLHVRYEIVESVRVPLLELLNRLVDLSKCSQPVGAPLQHKLTAGSAADSQSKDKQNGQPL